MPEGRASIGGTKAYELRRERVLRLNQDGKKIEDIAKALNVSYDTVSNDLRCLRRSGHETQEYQRRKWYDIIVEVNNALSFYEGRRKPTLRTMHYHLETVARETGRIDYKRDSSHYDRLSKYTSIARKRSINPDYVPPHGRYEIPMLPTLPIDCFVDENRSSEGSETDMTDPKDPQAPQNWHEYIHDAIEELKAAPDDYDGEGDPGIEPGRWYWQEYYPEVWVEKGTAKPYIEDALVKKKVKVFDNGGNHSTSFMHENCTRLQRVLDENSDINVVVLYVGDSDSYGTDMDDTIEYEMYNLYGFDEDRVEFHRIAVTDEQIEEFKASTSEIEAFLTPKNIKKFEKLLQDAVDEYWDKDVYDNAMKEFQDKQDAIDIVDVDEVKPKMIQIIKEAFYDGWENDLEEKE